MFIDDNNTCLLCHGCSLYKRSVRGRDGPPITSNLWSSMSPRTAHQQPLFFVCLSQTAIRRRTGSYPVSLSLGWDCQSPTHSMSSKIVTRELYGTHQHIITISASLLQWVHSLSCSWIRLSYLSLSELNHCQLFVKTVSMFSIIMVLGSETNLLLCFLASRWDCLKSYRPHQHQIKIVWNDELMHCTDISLSCVFVLSSWAGLD